MNFCSNIALYFLISSALIFCGGNTMSAADSTSRKEYKTAEIEVDAKRNYSKNAYKFNSTVKIERAEIEKYPGSGITGIISSVPGFYIKDYGGRSALKTVSLRGTSASQTQVNLNGISLNSNQNGIFDLSLFPASMISGIELSRGGLSVEGGNNSLAGTVAFDIQPNTGSILESTVDYGSYDHLAMDLNYNDDINKNPYSLFMSYSQGTGDFEYRNSSGVTQKRINSEYDSFNAAIVSKLNLLGFRLTPIFLSKYDSKGVPGAVLRDRTLNSSASSERLFALGSIKAEKFLSPELLFTIVPAFTFEDLNYNDSDSLSSVTDKSNQFYSRSFMLNSNIFWQSGDLTLKTGINVEHSSVNGSFLDPNVGSSRSRDVLGLFLSGIYEINDKYLETEFSNSLGWTIFNDFLPVPTFSTGALSKFKNLPVYFKLNFSKNFRLPSFNEMYYLNYGNVDLKPEKSISFNSAILYEPIKNLNFEVSAFSIATYDLILSVPKSPVAWSVQNIGYAVTNGIEFLTKFEIEELLYLTFAYTLQSAEDQSLNSLTEGKKIPYIPQEIISGNMFLDISDFVFGANIAYSSHRFALPDNSYESLLENYIEIDSYIEYKFTDNPQFALRFEVNNITDKSYSIIKNYPMPGRNFNLSARFKL